jgi:O-acetylhomoserine/O-acetylserine sulfhydrylase-like pyridoxal-dependent enzyme
MASASAREWPPSNIRSSTSPRRETTSFLLPQLYGATYTLLAHIFPETRNFIALCKATDRPEDVEKLIDENTRAVYCESVGNPAGNVADIEGLAVSRTSTVCRWWSTTP